MSIHLLSAGQTRERSPNLLDVKTKYIKTIIFRFNFYGTAVFIYVYINKSDNHHIVSTPALHFAFSLCQSWQDFFIQSTFTNKCIQ